MSPSLDRPGRSRAGKQRIRRLAAAVCAKSVAVQDEFLAPPQVRALSICARLRLLRGEFAAARIGGARTVQRLDEIRGDSICWLKEPLMPAERELMLAFEELRLALNRAGYLGLFDAELHYARYAPGAAYARHVDQPQGRAQRRVSLALYLNDAWEGREGGELVIFGAAASRREIEPIGGRLVCFRTALREHEVLPARRVRLSISGWFRTRD